MADLPAPQRRDAASDGSVVRPILWEGPGFTNFGDALNLWLWERLGLTPFFNDQPGLLYGIGSILNEHLSSERPLIIFGSGVGYGTPPDLKGVEVMFVRGPRSARHLGGVPWITDPAILTATLPAPAKREGTIFIPHWETAADDDTLGPRLAEIGIRLVDPRWRVERVLSEINASTFVMAEALHGAVVADALRVPWIPIYTQHVYLFKWFDWAASMELTYEPEFVSVQSLYEIMRDGRWQLSRQSVLDDRLARVQSQVERLRERLSR